MKFEEKEREINILLCEKRGCDFWKDDEEMQKYSDIGNYRIFCKGLNISGITTYIDISRGVKNVFIKDKHGVIIGHKTQHNHAVSFHIYQLKYENNYIKEFGNRSLEKKLQSMSHTYTYAKNDILKAINKINDFPIERILIFDNIYNKIEEIAGYREKHILDFCNKITLIQDDEKYQVLRFYSNEDYFAYETKSNRIVG